MKIIDILNKMANGELEDGFKFKYDNDTYKYNKKEDEIVSIEHGVCLGNYYTVEGILNNEVEVIEENKEIEEISIDEVDNKVALKNKINELARVVNKINKQLEEQETEDIDTVEKELNKMFKEREEK